MKKIKAFKYDGTTGKFLAQYSSITQASQENGLLVDGSNIFHAMRRNIKAGGYYWSKKKMRQYPVPVVPEKKEVKKEFKEEDFLKRLKRGGFSKKELSDKFSISVNEVQEKIDRLINEQKLMITKREEGFYIKEEPPHGGHVWLNPKMWKGDELKFGFVSDNHLGCHRERLDVLNLLYDIFEQEGVHTVLHGGNMIEGEARFTRNELHTFGLDNQVDYLINNYPYKQGIETWYVSADDHEGWWNQKIGINVGEYFQMKRERAGMFDFKHLGYMEADIELNEDSQYEQPQWLRIMHPGGGTAYAISYRPQKIVESFQGGEKPTILMIGHFHKGEYLPIRNVHCIQMMCTCDQTIYLRKKSIEVVVGGGMVTMVRNKEGLICRVKPEFITFYDKTFYKGKDKYWKG
jgi:hypothetical protein